MSHMLWLPSITDQPVTIGELVKTAAAALLFWLFVTVALWAVM